MQNKLKESILDPNEFTVTWELVPGRGAEEKSQETIFENAQEATKSDLIDGISITDNPSGTPAISAEYLGAKLKEMGLEPLVHFTAKDKSRNQMESFLYSLEREGVYNLLLMTGDYPTDGYRGQSQPVFDLDSTQMIELVTSLNAGLEYNDAYGRSQQLKETHFFPGAVVSPFKQKEEELLSQYYKLAKKIQAGAKFIITQLGYDARKFHELKLYADINDWDVSLIGNVYLLSHPAARVMNANQIPGCVVTDDLLNQLAKEKKSDDKGKKARLLRGSKMYAFMKGMGYHGVHIGGHGISLEDVEFVINKGEELTTDWRDFVPEFNYPMEEGFYYFEKDEKSGLNKSAPVTTDKSTRKSFRYTIFRILHRLLFELDSPFFRPMQSISRLVDDSFLEKRFLAIERLMKTITNDCQECGDCALFDLAYLCPMSQCPKNQRNGPCGGSRDGWCEVYPDEKECVYVKAYRRLKAYQEEEQLKEEWIPPVNWDLHHSSSWLNFYLGRDHTAKKMGIKQPDKS